MSSLGSPSEAGTSLLDLPTFEQMNKDERYQLHGEAIALFESIADPATTGRDIEAALALDDAPAGEGGDPNNEDGEPEGGAGAKYPHLAAILRDPAASAGGASPLDVVLEPPLTPPADGDVPTTLLLHAALHANADVASWLLDRGADATLAPSASARRRGALDRSTGPLLTPLHAAVAGATRDGGGGGAPRRGGARLRVIRDLMERGGADPSARDSDGRRPLDVLYAAAAAAATAEERGRLRDVIEAVEAAGAPANPGLAEESPVVLEEAASKQGPLLDAAIMEGGHLAPNTAALPPTPTAQVSTHDAATHPLPAAVSKQGSTSRSADRSALARFDTGHSCQGQQGADPARGQDDGARQLRCRAETKPAAGAGASTVREPKSGADSTGAPSAPTGAAFPLRAMSWNILASCHTAHNAPAHGRPGRAEGDDRRRVRHAAIARRIEAEAPDVALLQEVDEHFIPAAAAGRGHLDSPALGGAPTLGGYTAYLAYGRTRGGVREGVAILLRDSAWELDPSLPTLALEKGPRTGWKSGLVLHARRHGGSGTVCCFASVHLPWGNDKAKGALLDDILAKAKPEVPVVLGGDFNTHTSELVGAAFEAPLRERGLRRMPTAPGVATCLGACPWVRVGTQVIDHLYCTSDLVFTADMDSCAVGRLPLPPLGPWAHGDNDGSDHAWIMADLVCCKGHRPQPPLDPKDEERDCPAGPRQPVTAALTHMPTRTAQLAGKEAPNTAVQIKARYTATHPLPAGATPPARGDKHEISVLWYWETDAGSWQPFHDDANSELERSHSACEAGATFAIGSETYYVDFATSTQRNVFTGASRSVCRGWPGPDAHCQGNIARQRQQCHGGTTNCPAGKPAGAEVPENRMGKSHENSKGDSITQARSTSINAGGRAANSYLKGVLNERAINEMHRMALTLQRETAKLFPEQRESRQNSEGGRMKGLQRRRSSRPKLCTPPKAVRRMTEKAKHALAHSQLGVRSAGNPTVQVQKFNKADSQRKPPLRIKPRSRNSLHITMFFGGMVLCALPPRDLRAWHKKLVGRLQLQPEKVTVSDGRSDAGCTTSGGDREEHTLQFRGLDTFPPHRRNFIVAVFDASPALRRLHKDLRDIALESESDQLRSVVKRSNTNLTFHVTIGNIIGGSAAEVQRLQRMLENGLGRTGNNPSEGIEVELADCAIGAKLCEENTAFEAKVLGLAMGGPVPPQVPELDWNFTFGKRAKAGETAKAAPEPMQAKAKTKPTVCECAPKAAGEATTKD